MRKFADRFISSEKNETKMNKIVNHNFNFSQLPRNLQLSVLAFILDENIDIIFFKYLEKSPQKNDINKFLPTTLVDLQLVSKEWRVLTHRWKVELNNYVKSFLNPFLLKNPDLLKDSFVLGRRFGGMLQHFRINDLLRPVNFFLQDQPIELQMQLYEDVLNSCETWREKLNSEEIDKRIILSKEKDKFYRGYQVTHQALKNFYRIYVNLDEFMQTDFNLVSGSYRGRDGLSIYRNHFKIEMLISLTKIKNIPIKSYYENRGKQRIKSILKDSTRSEVVLEMVNNTPEAHDLYEMRENRLVMASILFVYLAIVIISSILPGWNIESYDPNKAVKTIDDYSRILKAVTPLNPTRSVTCCDAWLDYHGSVDDFVAIYKKRIIRQARRDVNRDEANRRDSNPREPIPQSKFKVTAYDYSIPSFRKKRDEDNPQLRCFIKNSLRWMLGIFDRIHSMEQIYDATIKLQRPQQSFSKC